MKSLILLFITLNVPTAFGQAPSAAIPCQEEITQVLKAAVTTPAPLDLHTVTSIDQVADKLWAVHATDYPPTDGTLHVHMAPQEMDPTLHFAIGQLVPPHENGSWEDQKYAVLVPVKDVYPQTLNFMANDLISLGDLKLPKDSVLVAPKGALSSATGMTISEYDPATTHLRDAIESAIKSRGGLVLTLRENTDQFMYQGGEFTDYVTFRDLFDKEGYAVNAPSVNSADFFKSVMDRHPGTSFGTHNRSLVGDNGRFGQVFFSFERVFGAWPNPGMSTEELAAIRAMTTVNLAKMDQKVASLELNPNARVAAQTTYDAFRKEATGLLNLIDADLTLRKSSGKSFFAQATAAQKADLYASRFDPAKIAQLVKQGSGTWGDAPTAWEPQPFNVFAALNIDLLSFKYNDLPALAAELEKNYPGFLISRGGTPFLTLAWATARDWQLFKVGAIGKELIQSENLNNIIDNAIAEAQKKIPTLPAASQDGAQFSLRDLTQNYAITKIVKGAPAIKPVAAPTAVSVPAAH